MDEFLCRGCRTKNKSQSILENQLKKNNKHALCTTN